MIYPLIATCYCQILAQADGPAPLLLRMDRDDRIRVFVALAAILLLGFIMIFLAWWAARWTRRYVNRPSRKQQQAAFPVLSPEDWASKRLHEPSDEEPPEPTE